MAMPTYLCVAFVTTIVLYFASNMLLVPDKDENRNLTGMMGINSGVSEYLRYLQEVVFCSVGNNVLARAVGQ